MNDEARMLCVSDEEIESYQLERLRKTLEAAKRAPYFADRLSGCRIESLDDLAKKAKLSKACI